MRRLATNFEAKLPNVVVWPLSFRRMGRQYLILVTAYFVFYDRAILHTMRLTKMKSTRPSISC
jgi:hypothetical protein